MTRKTGSFGKRAAVAVAAVVALVVASAALAANFVLTKTGENGSTVTLSYPAQAGADGYRYYAPGQVDGDRCTGTLLSRSFDPAKTSIRFAKVPSGRYCVEAVVLTPVGAGQYPAAVEPPPPPPPVAKVTQTIAQGSTITNLTAWRAVYDANNDGSEDDPGQIAFLIDGVVVLTESQAPFGDTFADGSITTTNGQHTFEVRALGDTGGVLVTNQVTATVNNVTPPPPPPPTGFPSAANTGVPAGVTLTPYTGPATVIVPGTVIDSKTIGCIQIEAANVKITRSRITCSAYWAVLVASTNASASLLAEDVEMTCNGANGNGFSERNITLRRVNLHHCENGLSVQENVTVEDSYIHDLTMANDAHADGMQFEPATPNVVIRHNTIFGMGSNGQFGTSALIADWSGHSNWLIENNLFGGGAFTVYCVAGKGNNWIIRNNAFTNRFSQAAGRGNNIGYFGHSNQCGDETQSGNYILETGQPITLG